MKNKIDQLRSGISMIESAYNTFFPHVRRCGGIGTDPIELWELLIGVTLLNVPVAGCSKVFWIIFVMN
jgi:hypothetical protein